MLKIFIRCFLFTVPFIGVSIVLLYMGYTAKPGSLTDDGYDLRTFLYSMGGFFLVFPTMIGLVLFLFAVRNQRRIEDLMANGVRGTALVLSLHDTGI